VARRQTRKGGTRPPAAGRWIGTTIRTASSVPEAVLRRKRCSSLSAIPSPVAEEGLHRAPIALQVVGDDGEQSDRRRVGDIGRSSPQRRILVAEASGDVEHHVEPRRSGGVGALVQREVDRVVVGRDRQVVRVRPTERREQRGRPRAPTRRSPRTAAVRSTPRGRCAVPRRADRRRSPRRLVVPHLAKCSGTADHCQVRERAPPAPGRGTARPGWTGSGRPDEPCSETTSGQR
jgi:hypothetical protein